MSLAIATICESIAALDVDGVRIADIDAIPEAADARRASIIPRPDGFITNFTMVRESFGGGSTSKMTITYRLTYRLLFAPIGEGRGLFAVYPDMVAAAYRFLDAILAIDTMTGLVDIIPVDALSFGPVTDPAGNAFHGCDIVLEVNEFVN
jgi:hypothetical protein